MSSAGTGQSSGPSGGGPLGEVWGLTGGIASGKSEVARLFAASGIPVIDADQISREIGQPGGPAHASLVKRFGTADRAELRRLVFADAQARKDLESIVHPLIVAESTRRIEAAQKMLAALRAHAGQPGVAAVSAIPVIYEAALLVETGRYKQLAGLLVVDAPTALRRQRLITRDGVAADLADRILSAQAGDTERLAAATHVIPNHGTLEELRSAVHTLIGRLGWARSGR